MFNKKIRNKIKLFAGMLLCAVAVLAAPTTSISVCAATITPDVEICTDILEWVYKVMDGKMYKALFNCSTGQYVTDWQYVCDWPEGIE